MNPTDQVVKFMLENASTAEEVAHLAGLLPESSLLNANPKVAFPPSWVLARQKDSVNLAVYAIRHCEDPDTLAACVPMANRLSVLEALSESKYLSATARVALEAKTAKWKESAHKAFLKAIPARLAKLLDAFRGAYSLGDINELLSNELVPASFVDELVDSLITRDYDAMLQSYMASSFGITDTPLYQAFWARSSRDPLVMFNGLSPEVRHRLSLKLVAMASDNYYSKIGSDLIPADVTASIIEALAQEPDRIPEINRALHKVRHTYTDESIDPPTAKLVGEGVRPIDNGLRKTQGSERSSPYSTTNQLCRGRIDLILAKPELASLLTYQRLNPLQLSRLITQVDPARLEDLLVIVGESSALALMVYQAMPESMEISDVPMTRLVLETMADASDPLLAEMINHASPSSLVDYITGRWHIRRRTIGPTADQLPGLLARLPQPLPDSLRATLSSFVSGIKHNDPLSSPYVKAYLDTVPGAASGALDSSPCGSYVHQRLLSTGASADVILDQLTLAPTVSLNHLCEVLSAMAKMMH